MLLMLNMKLKLLRNVTRNTEEEGDIIKQEEKERGGIGVKKRVWGFVLRI